MNKRGMKDLFKDLFNVAKYKRRANTYKNKYESVLPEKIQELDYVKDLQAKVIRLQNDIIDKQSELLKYKEKEIRKLKEKK